MIISDDCRINLILGEFMKLQSDEIPKQRISNENGQTIIGSENYR